MQFTLKLLSPRDNMIAKYREVPKCANYFKPKVLGL